MLHTMMNSASLGRKWSVWLYFPEDHTPQVTSPTSVKSKSDTQFLSSADGHDEGLMGIEYSQLGQAHLL